MSYDDFEQQVLTLAYETDLRLTPASVAYRLGCPVREAQRHLRRMLDDQILELDSDDEGNLLYELPGRDTHVGAASAVVLPPPQTRLRRAALTLNLLLPGSGSALLGRWAPAAGQAALALVSGTVAMLFWKDFGDAEHKPWLVLLAAGWLGSVLWGVRTVSKPPDEVP